MNEVYVCLRDDRSCCHLSWPSYSLGSAVLRELHFTQVHQSVLGSDCVIYFWVPVADEAEWVQGSRLTPSGHGLSALAWLCSDCYKRTGSVEQAVYEANAVYGKANAR